MPNNCSIIFLLFIDISTPKTTKNTKSSRDGMARAHCFGSVYWSKLGTEHSVTNIFYITDDLVALEVKPQF
ncbi:hypothetical protein BDFB_014815 [Asbolus verrucosus]|uniref:Uncharacterized protein n=1 Tax=Asbolus verrucosus TaxID=1661398 RepID=A0A482VL19_ASBVE|nr:hypothetical protein BDFB_014815 [Asbolus verrucosus]